MPCNTPHDIQVVINPCHGWANYGLWQFWPKRQITAHLLSKMLVMPVTATTTAVHELHQAVLAASHTDWKKTAACLYQHSVLCTCHQLSKHSPV